MNLSGLWRLCNTRAQNLRRDVSQISNLGMLDLIPRDMKVYTPNVKVAALLLVQELVILFYIDPDLSDCEGDHLHSALSISFHTFLVGSIWAIPKHWSLSFEAISLLTWKFFIYSCPTEVFSQKRLVFEADPWFPLFWFEPQSQLKKISSIEWCHHHHAFLVMSCFCTNISFRILSETFYLGLDRPQQSFWGAEILCFSPEEGLPSFHPTPIA